MKNERTEQLIKSKEPDRVHTDHCEEQIIEHQGQIGDADQSVHFVDRWFFGVEKLYSQSIHKNQSIGFYRRFASEWRNKHEVVEH